MILLNIFTLSTRWIIKLAHHNMYLTLRRLYLMIKLPKATPIKQNDNHMVNQLLNLFTSSTYCNNLGFLENVLPSRQRNRWIFDMTDTPTLYVWFAAQWPATSSSVRNLVSQCRQDRFMPFNPVWSCRQCSARICVPQPCWSHNKHHQCYNEPPLVIYYYKSFSLKYLYC